MRLLLETLRCEEGLPLHLQYHQRRLDATLASLGIAERYDLQSLVIPPAEGIWRCRFLYGNDGYEIEFYPYVPRPMNALKLLHAPLIDYPFKYADRRALEVLFAQRGECDDVLIVRGDLLCDTTIANVALLIGGKWLTPERPLLLGTTRARLIDEGLLIPAPLVTADIARAEKVAVMNAIMGFVEVENGIIF